MSLFSVFRGKSALLAAAALFPMISTLAVALERSNQAGVEANSILPDLAQDTFFGGAINGQTLLTFARRGARAGFRFGHS